MAFRFVIVRSAARSILVVIAWALLSGVVIVSSLAAARPAAATGQLAFVSSEEGSRQISVVNADGTGLHRLTGPRGESWTPAWSPDGRRLAFVHSRDGSTQIYTMASDGSGPRRLTAPPGDSTFPAWSPDGKSIVFVSTRGESAQIYLMHADGSGQRRLTGSPGQSTVPAWSPDGRRLAFVSTRDGGVPQLFVMNADGTGQRRLTGPDVYVANAFGRGPKRFAAGGVLLRPGVLHPVWLPGGGRIAFVTRVGRAEQAIEEVRPDGSERIRIATGYAPAWSSDGRHLAFVVARVGDAQIYAMDSDGRGLRRLTPFGINLLPAWSPDGHWIAFLGSRDSSLGLYVMVSDGSGQRRLAPVAGDLSALPVFSWRPR